MNDPEKPEQHPGRPLTSLSDAELARLIPDPGRVTLRDVRTVDQADRDLARKYPDPHRLA